MLVRHCRRCADLGAGGSDSRKKQGADEGQPDRFGGCTSPGWSFSLVGSE